MSDCSASALAAASANVPWRVNDFSAYPIAFFADILQGDDFFLPITFYASGGGGTGEDLTGQTFALSVDWKFYEREWGWQNYLGKPCLLYSQVLAGDSSGEIFFNIPGYGASGLPYLPGWCDCFGGPCPTLPIGTLAVEIKRWYPSGLRVTTLKGNLIVRRSVTFSAVPVLPLPA